MKKKTCAKCKIYKRTDAFSPHPEGGFLPYCDACKAKHYTIYRKRPLMRVTRDNNYTTFRQTTPREIISMAVRRVFHPVRGEEIQLEFEVSHRKSVRTVVTRASATMAPLEAHEFAKILQGYYRPPQQAIRADIENVYEPKGYAVMTAEQKVMVRAAFEAGRDYERSLVV